MRKQPEYKLPWIFTEGVYSRAGGALFCVASAWIGNVLHLVCLRDTYWIDSFWAFFYTALFTMPVAVLAIWGIPLFLIQIALLFCKLFDEIPIFHVFFGFCITQYLAGIIMTAQLENYSWQYDSNRIMLLAFIPLVLAALYLITHLQYQKARKKLPQIQYATRRRRSRYPGEDTTPAASEPGSSQNPQLEKDRVSRLKTPY